MSMQAGVWNLDNEPVNRDFLTRISRNLSEYGPDGESIYVDGPVGMLYRPFHTAAESRFEHQPHVSPAGVLITWDGRLDNRKELISQLWEEITTDRTDVAIVGAAFDRWGTDCFARFVGDWALAIWNPLKRELFLARDYIGIRHLFYYPRPKRIMWCNHLAPLALCGDKFTLCDEYIASYLAQWPDAHLTPYREINSVAPGKFVHMRPTNLMTRTYWAFNTRLKTIYKTDMEYEEHYRHLFRQAVHRRLRTDSPVLAELSGGFDSSSIVCMADDILAREGAQAPRLDTFSYHDPNEPEDDDLQHVTKVEEKRGKRGFHADLRGAGVSLDFEYQVFVATPGFRNRTEVKAALSEILKEREHRVMLSGFGGDEMNGQALNPRIQMADLLLQLRMVTLAKQLIVWSLLIRKRPCIHLFFQTLRELMPVSIRARLTDQGEVEQWVNNTFAKKHRMSVRQLGAVEGLGLARPSARDAAETIATLARFMTFTAPSTIEKCYPYLDQNLVEFLTSIPPDQLLRPGERRSLMRRALSQVLPPEVLTRKTKASAVRCFCVSLARQWEKLEVIFRLPLSSRLGYIEKNEFRKALLALKNGKISGHTVNLLNALSLELWLRDIQARGLISIDPEPLPTLGTALLESRT